MALWGKLDRANNAPFGHGWQGETNAFCNALFGNTTSLQQRKKHCESMKLALDVSLT